jgi:FdhE protein
MANRHLDTEELAAELERLYSTRPHLGTLLRAFGPMIVEKTQWLADTAIDPANIDIDDERLASGIALGQQCQLIAVDAPWGSAGWAVARAIGEGFPKLRSDMEVLLRRFIEKKYDFFGTFLASGDGDDADGQCTRQAEEVGISALALHFFVRCLHRFMLAKKSRDVQPFLEGHKWSKGYCPVCGSLPLLAVLGENGRRLLHCADCGHHWPFPRLACPSCDHEDPENSNLLFIDECKEESAYFCDRCRSYLLTANRSTAIAPYHPELVALSMVHLDLILQEKGYSPMARSEWNGFDLEKGDEEEQ